LPGKSKIRPSEQVGIPRRRTWSPLSEDCPEGACGLLAADLDESDPLLAGWALVQVLGSKEPPRLFCSARCATRGLSLAALRMPAEARL
jgi:hypothetical protein